MRARGQVWSDENEAEETEPAAEQPQPEQARPPQPQPAEAQPEPAPMPTTPATEQQPQTSPERTGLPCIHVLEAFFAAEVVAPSPGPDADQGTAQASPAFEESQGPTLAGLALSLPLLGGMRQTTGKSDQRRRAGLAVTS
jgi:outer membrane biosynthesis protein TonB